MMMITNIQTLAHVMYLSLQGNGIKLTVQKCAILRIFAHARPTKIRWPSHGRTWFGLCTPPAPRPGPTIN